MTESYRDEELDELGPHTEESLRALYDELVREKGSYVYREDCPTDSHIAGYYISAYGGLDGAIAGLERALSGEYQDLRAFPGDQDVLDTLELVKLHQEPEAYPSV